MLQLKCLETFKMIRIDMLLIKFWVISYDRLLVLTTYLELPSWTLPLLVNHIFLITQVPMHGPCQPNCKLLQISFYIAVIHLCQSLLASATNHYPFSALKGRRLWKYHYTVVLLYCKSFRAHNIYNGRVSISQILHKSRSLEWKAPFFSCFYVLLGITSR